MASSSAVTLDDLAPAADGPLSYPKVEDPILERPPSPPEPQPRQLLKDRLYIGNLHPTVDEYALLQVFSKFGKVTKLDFLFHKAGVLKGKPRGYAFIEYGNQDDALRALTVAHDKPLRGRKLVVTFAHQAPMDQYGAMLPSSKTRKTMMDTGRPTTLSMIKTGMSNRQERKTQDKIAMMEAKLRQMEKTNPRPIPSSIASTPSDDIEMDSPSTSATTAPEVSASSLPYHPTLPSKPPPPLPNHITMAIAPPSNPNSRPKTGAPTKPKVVLPSLPMPPSSLQGHPSDPKSVNKTSGYHISPQTRPTKPSKLIGVKIKTKEKAQS